MKMIVNLSFLFFALLLLTTSSAAQSPGVAPVDYSQYGKPQIAGRVLLLIPEDFQRYVYVSIYEGKEIRDLNLEVRAYDYVVIPKFTRVDSSVENQKYGFDIDLLTEFYAKDGATVTKIGGHGESSTGKWFASTPQEGAKIALQYAVSAVLDGVEGNRNLFVQ